MSLTTNFSPNVVRVPLLGRAAIRATLATDISNDVIVVAEVLRHPDSASALFSLSSEDAEIVVTDGVGEIFIAVSADNQALLSAQGLFTLLVKLVNASDETTVEYAETFALLPINQFIADDYTSNMSAFLSTRFDNTLSLAGEAGGTGYLDGLTTVGQTVGCFVTFAPTGENPQQWKLIASTAATDAGSVRRPLDFNAVTNAKVWVKIT